MEEKNRHVIYIPTHRSAMSHWVALTNQTDDSKTARMEHMFTFNECTCTSSIRDPECSRYTVQLDYIPLCARLGFDPTKRLFIACTNEEIPVVEPATPLSADFTEPTVRVVRIPIHKCDTDGITLTQNEQVIEKAIMENNQS
jgi:hypothetical protein